MYSQSVVVLLLLLCNFYCHALPFPSIDFNEQTATTTMEQSLASNSDQWMSLQTLHEYEFLRMLCELYGRCSSDEDIDNDEETMFDYHQTKFKRFSSRLFYGIPKFG